MDVVVKKKFAMPEIHATLVKIFLAERAAPGKILGTDARRA